MRRVIIIIGLLLLVQLIWVSGSQAAPPESGGFWHTVHRGETLFSLGRRYDVNPYAICRANRLYNCNYIRAGQRLWIPYGTGPYPSYCSAYHVVSRGQTLYRISRIYGVPAWRIAEVNHIQNWNHIYAGQRLCIP